MAPLEVASLTPKMLKSALFFTVIVISLLLFSSNVVSKSIISALPGYPGNLPFMLETGYVSVGESEDLQLFYYFVESERDPLQDPLILWLTGGPGCSGLSPFLYVTGPLHFDVAAFNGSFPTLMLNPYSWTKVASIIFLDAPVGTGFSYSKTSEGYNVSDTKSATEIYDFLRKWLIDHPMFTKNPLYVGGDSYAGIFVPMVVTKISNGNEAGQKPHMNIKGYVLGNPGTDPHIDSNSQIPFAHRTALISDELYESAKRSCNGEFISPDPDNAKCREDLQHIKECIAKVNGPHILERKCNVLSPKPDELNWGGRFFDDITTDVLLQFPQGLDPRCRNFNHAFSDIWANDQSVREALKIEAGTVTYWTRCNKSLSYVYDVENVVNYHQNLSNKGYRVLIYSGDHDMMVPYLGTRTWIRSLNLTISSSWRPWFVDGQVAGYTEKYEKNGYSLTFATVKGGGHTAPEYNPVECLEMVDRWFSDHPLYYD